MELKEAMKFVEDFTIKFAKEKFNKDIKIKFTNTYHTWGTCYPYKNLIRYSIPYIEENKDSKEALEALAIHECCHIKHQNHKFDFKLLCESFGINEIHSRTLDYVNSPKPKKYYLFKCPKCGDIRKRLKMMKIKYACKKCCDKYNDGDFSNDFRFRLEGYVDETKVTEK